MIIHTKSITVGIVGLGYVGLPVAHAFSEQYHVIGFDINRVKIEELQIYEDRTKQLSKAQLKESGITFTDDATQLRKCSYIIVTVPTPLTKSNEPDLSYLKHAAAIIGENLAKHTLIIFESTVYPGTTEDICLPIIEEKSHFIAGKDFLVAYSPERINPGDKKHPFKKIPKIVSGQNETALQKVAQLYRSVLDAEVHEAPLIKVAEAAKILENTQRDVNIALMNEFSHICHHLQINTHDVLAAAKTKWNFTPYTPGLVGGHCIGIDPYYLIYKAKSAGYHPELMQIARKINDYMPFYVLQSLLEWVKKQKIDLRQVHVTLLGVTFKENIPDTRNSKALDILKQLIELGISTEVCDPYADEKEITATYHVPCKKKISQLNNTNVVILAVPHRDFDMQELYTFLKDNNVTFLMDIKGVIQANELPKNCTLWCL